MKNTARNLIYGIMFAGMVVFGIQNMQVLADDEVTVLDENTESQEEQVDTDENIPDGVEDPANKSEEEVYRIDYKVESKEVTSDTYVSIDTAFTPENTNEQLRLIATAIKESNKDALIEGLEKCYKTTAYPMGDTTPINFINEQFVDAEKWVKNGIPGYDGKLCWAEVASNMLWTSGWAQGVINPITGVAFTSEDDVAAYFSTYFTNGLGYSSNGLEWFFNGEYNVPYEQNYTQETDNTSPSKYVEGNIYGYGVDQTGFFPQYDITTIQKNYDLRNSNPEYISVLEGLGKNIVAEISIETYYQMSPTTEPWAQGSHAVTVVGIIIDTTKEGLNKYVALLVANSDSDIPNEAKSTSTDVFSAPTIGNLVPENYKTVVSDKENVVNKYTLYYLELVTDYNGITWWNLKNNSYVSPNLGKYYTFIKRIQTLEIKPEEEKKEESKIDTNSNVTKVTVHNVQTTSTVQTGIITSSASFLSLMISSLGVMILCLKKLLK